MAYSGGYVAIAMWAWGSCRGGGGGGEGGGGTMGGFWRGGGGGGGGGWCVRVRKSGVLVSAVGYSESHEGTDCLTQYFNAFVGQLLLLQVSFFVLCLCFPHRTPPFGRLTCTVPMWKACDDSTTTMPKCGL